ncbi:MAG TPA: carboxypeptidase regulatory-like domain-containing protein [Candidatus Thermoplasmatota archaeon]|nr:carboxypeptidase regulatory-like domain-containing protein [Candidatus Thermoplasmatota archaeon]
MRTSALAALLLPALLAGCLAEGPAEPVPTGQIDGAVVDHLLHPYADQTVYLSQLGRSDQTSALGGFTFRNVPVGSYTLLAAHEGTQGAAAVVEVEADRVTKVILQLMPTPVREPHMAIFPSHSGFEDLASYSQECKSCAWTVPLEGDERPAEVVFEWRWETSALADNGDDTLRFQVVDDRGDLLYRREAGGSPFTAALDGEDIPDDARELRVQVWFGPGFVPRANFRLESYVTVYYGATSEELFSPH